MRHITQRGVDLIAGFEKCVLHVYDDGVGVWTIGYGHTRAVSADTPAITYAEALDLLRDDLRGAERAVLRLITVPLTDGQFDALVSFVFNLGAGTLQRSTLRRKVNRREYAAATVEFAKYVFAGGRKLKGLVRRRAAEVVLFAA